MKTKNTLIDVHNFLMEELERLADPDIMDDPVQAAQETRRASAMAKISNAIAGNLQTALKGRVAASEIDGNDAIDHVLCLEDADKDGVTA